MISPWLSRVGGSSTYLRRRLLLSRGDASYSAMTKPSQTAFYSSALKSLIPPWRCGVGKPSTLPRDIYDSSLTKPSHKDFYLAAATPRTSALKKLSRKGLYSAAMTPSIRYQCWLGKASTRPQRSLRFCHDNMESKSLCSAMMKVNRKSLRFGRGPTPFTQFDQVWGDGLPLSFYSHGPSRKRGRYLSLHSVWLSGKRGVFPLTLLGRTE